MKVSSLSDYAKWLSSKEGAEVMLRKYGKPPRGKAMSDELGPFDGSLTSEDDRLQLQLELMQARSAAFIAYGALMALNTDGRGDAVLAVLKKTLWPELEPSDP
jgi:hypothetical protein